MPPNSLPCYIYYLLTRTSHLSQDLASSKAGAVLLKVTPDNVVCLYTSRAVPNGIFRLLGKRPSDVLILQLHARRLLVQGRVEWKSLNQAKEKKGKMYDLDSGCGAWMVRRACWIK